MKRSPWKLLLALVLACGALTLIGAGASLRVRAQYAGAEVLSAFEGFDQADETATAGVAITANEGKLVWVAHQPAILSPAADDEGRVSAAGALVLATVIDRYEQHTTGTGSEKRTTQDWERSSGGSRWYAHVRLREFELAEDLLDRIPAEQPFVLDDATNLRLDPKQRIGANAVYYGGGTLDAPKLGDLRVAYFFAPNAEITVLARQRGRTLLRERRSSEAFGIPMQFEIGVSKLGRQEAETMFEAQRAQIRLGTLNVRIAGAIAIIVGGFLLFSAWGSWTGRAERRSWLQLLAPLAWPFMAVVLAPIEALLAAQIASPALLLVASGVAALCLAVLMIAAYVALDLSRAQRGPGTAA